MSLSRLDDDTVRLGTRGWMCPYPKYLIEKLLRTIGPTKIIEVLVDCPSSATDVPATASQYGYEAISTSRMKDGEWRLVFRKRGAPLS